MNSTFMNQLGQGKASTFCPFLLLIDAFCVNNAETEDQNLLLQKMILLGNLLFWRVRISSSLCVDQFFPNAQIRITNFKSQISG